MRFLAFSLGKIASVSTLNFGSMIALVELVQSHRIHAEFNKTLSIHWAHSYL